VVVWTGRAVLIWGGVTDGATVLLGPDGTYPPGYNGYTGTARTDGAAFNPKTRQWSSIPDAPIPFLGFDASSAWTGHEMLVWGTEYSLTASHSAGALYDPSTRRWRQMAHQDTVDVGAGVWTGTEWIVAGNAAGSNRIAAAAYRPETDTWRQLPAPPTPNVPRSRPVWTGTLALFGIPVLSDVPLAYNPATNQWVTMPPSPFGERLETTTAWTGDVMLETTRRYAPGARGDDVMIPKPGYGRFDPASAKWEQMQAPPQDVSFGQTVDHHAVFGTPSSLLAYDGRTDEWTTLPAPAELGVLVWTGDELWNVVMAHLGSPGALSRYVPQ